MRVVTGVITDATTRCLARGCLCMARQLCSAFLSVAAVARCGRGSDREDGDEYHRLRVIAGDEQIACSLARRLALVGFPTHGCARLRF